MKIIIPLFALIFFQFAFSCSPGRHVTYVEYYNESQKVIVVQVEKIQLTPPEKGISRNKFIKAKKSNDEINIRISNIQDNLKNLKRLSLSFDKEKEQLNKEISTIEKSDSSRKINNLLRQLNYKLKTNYYENKYKETLETKLLEDKQDNLRNKYIGQVDISAKTRSQLELIKLKTRFNLRAIEDYQEDIEYFQNKLINLRPLAGDFIVKMKLLKIFKGNSEENISFEVKVNNNTPSSWCGFQFTNYLYSVKPNEIITLFEKNDRIVNLKSYGSKPSNNWRKIMAEIKAGTYKKDSENSNMWIATTSIGGKHTEILSSGSYSTALSRGALSYFLPKKSCPTRKSIQFESVKKYNNTTNVIVAKVTKIEVEPTEDISLINKSSTIENEINDILGRVKNKLNKVKQLTNYRTKIDELQEQIATLEKENTNIIALNKINKLGHKIKTIYHANHRQNTTIIEALRENKSKLLEEFIAYVTNLIEMKSLMSILTLKNSFRDEDITTHQENIDELLLVRKKLKNYYAGTITVEMEVIESFKGKLALGEKLSFVSKKRNHNDCAYEFTNSYLYSAIQKDLVSLYLDENNNVKKWDKFWFDYNDPYWKDNHHKEMKEIKDGTYKY